MKEVLCKDCGERLSKDEVALTKKLINPKTKEFLCLKCMGENFGCSVEDLQIKIDEFKEEGCSLFV